MAYWLAASLLLALASLAAARYLSSPLWIDALLATGASLGLALAMAAGLGLRRWLGAERWLGAAAFLLALAASIGRMQLLSRISAGAPPEIDFPRLALAASTVVWGAVALGWGGLALSDALTLSPSWDGLDGRPPRRSESAGAPARRRRWAGVGLGGGAVALALYSLAPLWYLLDLRINHWTVLGLFGLAGMAYGVGQGWRWLRRGARARE